MSVAAQRNKSLFKSWTVRLLILFRISSVVRAIFSFSARISQEGAIWGGSFPNLSDPFYSRIQSQYLGHTYRNSDLHDWPIERQQLRQQNNLWVQFGWPIFWLHLFSTVKVKQAKLGALNQHVLYCTYMEHPPSWRWMGPMAFPKCSATDAPSSEESFPPEDWLTARYFCWSRLAKGDFSTDMD